MRDHYDDGGISGGTLERPALQRLLSDIEDGLVDVFDRNNVNFVSVTQSLNTTTSMGRLTLNLLLSFAQFEREVTAERIRDKIKARPRPMCSITLSASTTPSSGIPRSGISAPLSSIVRLS